MRVFNTQEPSLNPAAVPQPSWNITDALLAKKLGIFSFWMKLRTHSSFDRGT